MFFIMNNYDEKNKCFIFFFLKYSIVATGFNYIYSRINWQVITVVGGFLLFSVGGFTGRHSIVIFGFSFFNSEVYFRIFFLFLLEIA